MADTPATVARNERASNPADRRRPARAEKRAEPDELTEVQRAHAGGCRGHRVTYHKGYGVDLANVMKARLAEREEKSDKKQQRVTEADLDDEAALSLRRDEVSKLSTGALVGHLAHLGYNRAKHVPAPRDGLYECPFPDAPTPQTDPHLITALREAEVERADEIAAYRK